LEAHHLKEIPQYTFAIINTSNTAFIGLLGLKLGHKKYRRAEVWYKIHPDYWSKGYASETLEGVLSYCFENLKLHRVEAGCAVDNIASFKVLEKCGFSREGRCREILPLTTGWSDNYEYAILEKDYKFKKKRPYER